MDEEYGADDALLAAMVAADAGQDRQGQVSQPLPQKIQQPTPQRMDKAPPSSNTPSKIVQPTPQALPQRQAGSSILVSPRQRGNPVLTCIRSLAWEYSDIPADYVLGLTTCALFLSLKYHRLHPEYVYTRIRNLQGKYGLRILLTMVDIPNHEDSLRELSKTSLVNNVTIIACWSAAEAARYLELYKSYENASFTAIKGQQASSYADKLVEFVTVPRSLNKSDAVAMVANFGSLKNAINAESEQLALMNGFGGVKIKRWLSATGEPFRAKKAAKRGVTTSSSAVVRAVGPNGTSNLNRREDEWPLTTVPLAYTEPTTPSPAESASKESAEAPELQQETPVSQFHLERPSGENEVRSGIRGHGDLGSAETKKNRPGQSSVSADDGKTPTETLSGGVADALAKLRQGS